MQLDRDWPARAPRTRRELIVQNSIFGIRYNQCIPPRIITGSQIQKAATINSITSLLEKSLIARAPLFDSDHQSAFRLFNGFTEGSPEIVIDLYAATAVIHNYAENPDSGSVLVEEARQFLSTSLSWLSAVIVKTRNGATPEEKRGKFIFGIKISLLISRKF